MLHSQGHRRSSASISAFSFRKRVGWRMGKGFETAQEGKVMECNLGQGDLLRLEGGPKGVAICCLKGTIWLTKGDGTDYLISHGHNFRLAAGATALVEALGSAEVRLQSASCEGAPARPVLSPMTCRAV